MNEKSRLNYLSLSAREAHEIVLYRTRIFSFIVVAIPNVVNFRGEIYNVSKYRIDPLSM